MKPGRYHHYKGLEYEVLFTAKHSETLEPLVVYRAIYGNDEVWVRPLAMFLEHILVDGVETPRFLAIN